MRRLFLTYFALCATAFGWDIALQESGRYFLPLRGRFEPDPICAAASVACLSYDAVPVERVAVVDFELGVVFIHETVCGEYIYAPRAVPIDSFVEQMEWQRWRVSVRSSQGDQRRRGTQIEIPMDLPPTVRTIIGTGGAGLSVNGSYKITMSGRSEWSDREAFFGSKWPQLQMEQESRFTITGNIGSKIKVKVDQDSQRETDLENTINIKYTGEEDDVVQSIEAGNTTLSLPGFSLLGYSERVRGLFGIKGVFQVGDWNITTIASQEKANTQKVTVRPQASSVTKHIADYDYKARTYFYIDDQYVERTYSEGDSISFFELYICHPGQYSPNAVFAWALVDPGNSEDDLPPTLGTDSLSADSAVSGYFEKVDPSQYYVDRKHGWFRLNTQAGRDDIIGVMYICQHSDGTADTVGFIGSDSTTWYLKLIKPQSLQPTSPCWEYEWRNVYDLGVQDIRLEETFIRLFRWSGAVGTDSLETVPGNANVFMLTWYGMDSLDDISNEPSVTGDGIVDQLPYYIDASRGELIFPVPHPFDPQDIDVAICPALADFPDSLRNPAIYNSTESSEQQRYHHFFIFAETKGFSTAINLGYNIIPGSEVVKLNGVRLEKDKDYTILYEVGQLRLISERARDPNASLEITFEAQPFFSLQQKTLLGTSIKYELGEDSWFGVAGLYKSVTTPERRPRVGGEPTRAFIGAANLRLSQELPFLTKLVDALPLIQTDAPSSAVLSLEAAKLMSTPNTIGKAYIDDFEGSRGYDPISITRTMWTPASAPYGYSDQPRAKMIWYNPYDKVPVSHIWPNKEVPSQESTVDVLTLEFIDTTTAPGDSMPWAGIMQYINPAYQDQQDAQFLEIWVCGDEGVLNIDIGWISEDADGDGELDTEDKKVGGVYNNILDVDEDTGLDGLPDEQEPGYDPVTNPDPNGDNWYWDESNPYDYSHINGTEGNALDPLGLRKPDTEDLNRNGVLDIYNKYFEFKIDLSDSNFMVPGTRSEYGWRLYRIPLQDSLFRLVEDGRVHHRIEVGNPTLAEIKYIRLWLTDVPDGEAKVSIAQISFVRNQWDEDFDHFEVAVKNSQEDQDYSPPPGVEGERDPTTGITLAEQSLALKYKNLPPLDTVYAERTLSSEYAEDYTQYRRLTMWVYFDTSKSDGVPPILFFRFGDNQGNYYEYRTKTLYPGWDERNRVVVDFDELTFFKERYQEALSDTTGSTPLPDSLAGHGNGYYRVSGNPTLTSITHFEIGLINPDPNFPISGEVWCDELVVEDVREESGKAYKGEFTLTAADFATFIASVTSKDDDFHGLTETRSGSGYYYGYRSTTRRQRASTLEQSYTANFKLGKFFPYRWHALLPLSVSYKHSVSIPRFRTNSDVVVPDSLRDEEKTVTKTTTVSLPGIGVSPEEPGWALALFVVPNRLSYSYQKSTSSSPTYPEDYTTNYTITHKYELSPGREAGKLVFKIFERDSAEGKGLGGEGISISYVPSNVSLVTTVTARKVHKLNYQGTRTESFSRDLNHDLKLQFKPLEDVTADFSLNVKRDIHMPDWLQIGPPTIFGKPKSKTINDGVHWSPRFVKFLDQRYSLTSTYSENTQNPVAGSFGTANQNRTLRADLTLKWRELFGRRRGGRDTKLEGEKPKPWQRIRSVFDYIENLRGSFNWTCQTTAPNLARRPGRMFQLGLSGDPGSYIVSTSGQGGLIPTKTYTTTANLSTGAKLPVDVSLTTKYNYTSTRTLSSSANTKSVAQTFPDVSVNWNFVRKMKFFKKFATSTSAQSSWSHKVSKNYTEGEISQVTTTDQLKPLLSMNFNMKGGWTLSLRFNWETSLQATYNGPQISYSGSNKKTFEATAQYSLRAQKGIKLPLLGTLTLENNLNLSVTASYGTDVSKTWTASDPRKQRTRDKAKLSIKPRATYNLSRNARAGIEIEFTEDTDRLINDTRHIRDVKIWVEFNFGGSRGIGGSTIWGR